MLFAALTLAACGASGAVIMPAKVLIAVSVWPLAKDRISVGVLAIYQIWGYFSSGPKFSL
jgi:hypothetical protein